MPIREESLTSLLKWAKDRPEAHTIHVEAMSADGIMVDYAEFGRDRGRARPENAVAWALAVPGAASLRVCTVRPSGTHNEDGPGHETGEYETIA